jgi:hypothetical protein
VSVLDGKVLSAAAEHARPRKSDAFADPFIEIPALLALERAQVGEPVRRKVFHPRRIGQQLFRVIRVPLGKGFSFPRRLLGPEWFRGDQNRERQQA